MLLTSPLIEQAITLLDLPGSRGTPPRPRHHAAPSLRVKCEQKATNRPEQWLT